MPDTIILGAGAAGLMCALTAAKGGKQILVLEKSNKVGKKILMSGGGRCNFTNLNISAENFLSTNPHFCKGALTRYQQWDFIDLVERHGIEYEERKHGQLFCQHSAKDILSMLIQECESNGVVIETDIEIQSVSASDASFKLNCGQGRILRCNTLVVATGALSIPTLGGSSLGYDIALQFGHRLISRRAGLVPFTFTDQLKPLCENLSGIALNIEVSCRDQYFRENMLFTHRGMSGPAMLQISNYWQLGEVLHINLLPDINAYDLLKHGKQLGKQKLSSFLTQSLPKALVLELQTNWWPDYHDTLMAEIPDVLLKRVADNLNNWEVKPSGTEGYRTAEVTLGGVDTYDLSSKTMESKLQRGLYFIGEVLDVSGHLGGYNFQWAWSSGFSAGVAL
ncbi:MAG: NAD(P)/FAD-dependent oxidoreductase [Pseudomonadales bacterium]|nr:NAD(P)/FAD-dependent oxidoreductase [Pseudomonadales bacterium]